MQKILLVDDDANFLNSIELSLEDEITGVQFFSEHDGKDAWIKYQEIRPSLIITDYKMPVWNGSELAEQIRDKNNKIPIILITGYNDPVKKELFTEIVYKPFRMEEFLNSIRKCKNNLAVQNSKQICA